MDTQNKRTVAYSCKAQNRTKKEKLQHYRWSFSRWDAPFPRVTLVQGDFHIGELLAQADHITQMVIDHGGHGSSGILG